MKARLSFLVLFLFSSLFFVLPKFTRADMNPEELVKNQNKIELNEVDAKKILLSSIGQLNGKWIDVVSSPDASPQESAALGLVKKATGIDIANYLTFDYPKEISIKAIGAAIKIAQLLINNDISGIISQIESYTVSKAEEYLTNLLLANEIKISTGNLKISYYDTKDNWQEKTFPYIIALKDAGAADSYIAIGIYSPENLKAPKATVGLEWPGGTDEISPFIIRVQGTAKKEFGTYVWRESADVNVIFSEPVPKFEFKEPTLWEKIQNFFKIFNLPGAASVGTQISNLEAPFNVSNFNAGQKLGASLGISENPDKREDDLDGINKDIPAGDLNDSASISNDDISEILEDISEKIDAISQQVKKIAGQNDVLENNEDSAKGKSGETLAKKKSEPSLGSSSPASYPKILITEVQISGAGGENDEFVELYNPNDEDVDLSGWYMQKKTKNSANFSTFASSNLLNYRIIKARDYFLIARKDGSLSGSANIITNYSLAEDNALALKNPNGVITDKVGWGAASDFEAFSAPNPGNSNTLSRKWDDLSEDYIDTDNNWADFGLNNPTPGVKNIFGGAGQANPKTVGDYKGKILISEVRIADKEFVELYNATEKDIDISGLYFSYFSSGRDWNKPYRNKKFPGDSVIPYYGYYLIGLEGYQTENSGPNADWQPYSKPQLSNSSGAVAIFSDNPETAENAEAAQNLKIDAVSWGNSIVKETEPVSVPKVGESLSRKIIAENFVYQDTDNNKEDFESKAPAPENSKTGKSIPVYMTESSAWKTFQGNSRRTGQADSLGPINGMAENWSFDLGRTNNICGQTTTQPVISGGGEIYIGIGESCGENGEWGKVYAINADGSLKWEFTNLESPATNISIGSNSDIYISTKDSGLIAISPSGEEKWRFRENGIVNVSSLAVSPSQIYFTDQSRIYCLNFDGSEKWRAGNASFGGSVAAGPAIGLDGTVYAVWPGYKGMTDESVGRLVAYDKDNGEAKWSASLLYAASGPAVGPDGAIYVVYGELNNFGASRRLAAFSPSGVKKWESDGQYGSLFSPLITVSGDIILSDKWGEIVNQDSGRNIWEAFSRITIFSKDGEIMQASGPIEGRNIDNQPIINSAGAVFAPTTEYEKNILSNSLQIKNKNISMISEVGINWDFTLSGQPLSTLSMGEDNNIYVALADPDENNPEKIATKLYSFRPKEINFEPASMARIKMETQAINNNGSDDIFISTSDDIFRGETPKNYGSDDIFMSSDDIFSSTP